MYEGHAFWRKFEDKLAAVYIQTTKSSWDFLHLYNGTGSCSCRSIARKWILQGQD